MSDTGDIIITAGGVNDLDAVMQVMEDSFDPRFGEAWTTSQCASLLPMPGVWLALARKNTGLVGFTLARAVVKEAELLLLAVKKSEQKKGVGKLLLQHFIDSASNRGVTKFHLEVRAGNSAVKLYDSFGFIEAGRRKKYYTGTDGEIYDAITLLKIIRNL